MKHILLALLSISNYAFSASCKQLSQDLLAVDYKLNFEVCDPIKNSDCTHKGAYHELLLEYNEAMAKLIIEEGIVAIGKTIEDSHNSLRFLKDVNLNEAEHIFESLQDGLSKATLLEDVMDPRNLVSPSDKKNLKISMWSPSQIPDNKITEFANFKKYVSNTLCNKTKRKSFCKNIFNNTNSKKEKTQLLKTLHGFVLADREIIKAEGLGKSTTKVHDTDPTERYAGYLNRWEITGPNNKKMTLAEVKQKVKAQEGLKSYIDKYQQDKTEENAKLLIQKANSIPAINVSYASNSSDGVHKFLNENIRKTLMGTENAIGGFKDSLLTKQFKRNLENQLKVISETHNYLEAEIKERSKSIPNFKSNKRELSSNTQEIKAHKKLEDQLKKITACYDKKDKKNCLIEQRNALYKNSSNTAQQTNLKTLKENLEKIEKKLNQHNNLSPFKDYLIQKALIVNELRKPKCEEEVSIRKMTVKSSAYCNAEYADQIKDTKTIGILDSDMNEISIHMQNQIVSEKLEAGLSPETIAQHKQELKDKCRTNVKSERQHIKNLCRHFKAGKVTKKKIEVTRSETRRREVIYLDQAPIERKSDSSIFWNSFLQGSVSQIPTLVNSWANYDQTKNWHSTQLQSIQAQENYYLATKDYRDSYMTELNAFRASPPEYYTYQNYGTPYMNTGYNTQSTFQSDSSGSLYNQFNDPLQNMFNVPSTIAPQPGTMNGSVDFSYNLST
jgi:hypothetical protein